MQEWHYFLVDPGYLSLNAAVSRISGAIQFVGYNFAVRFMAKKHPALRTRTFIMKVNYVMPGFDSYIKLAFFWAVLLCSVLLRNIPSLKLQAV